VPTSSELRPGFILADEDGSSFKTQGVLEALCQQTAQCIARICSSTNSDKRGFTAPYSEKLRPARGSRRSDPFRPTRGEFLEKLISEMRRIIDAQQTTQLRPYFCRQTVVASGSVVASGWGNCDAGGLDFDTKEAEAHFGLGIDRGRTAGVRKKGSIPKANAPSRIRSATRRVRTGCLAGYGQAP
jgi:hypothetical protein